MTVRERQQAPGIGWIPIISPPSAPVEDAPIPRKVKVLDKALLLLLGLGCLCFAAYWAGRNALQPQLDKAQASLALQQVKAKELNDQLYDANQQLQSATLAESKIQAIRALVCTPTGEP